MRPAAVAAVLTAFGGRRLERIAVEPSPHVEVVELLAPQHAGEGLALDAPHVLVGNAFLQDSVEGIRLGKALRENALKVAEGGRARLARAQPHADGGAAASRNGAQVNSAYLSAFARGVYRFAAAVNYVVVEGVLKKSLHAGNTEQSCEVGLVIAEQQPI